MTIAELARKPSPGSGRLAPANSATKGWRSGTESRLIMKHAPRSRNRPASVTMKGWISQKSMMKPCSAPKPAPKASIIAPDSSGCQPTVSRLAITTPTKPIIEPIDRSMPPERMTKVVPIAAMMMKALSARMSPSTSVETEIVVEHPAGDEQGEKTAIVAISGRYFSFIAPSRRNTRTSTARSIRRLQQQNDQPRPPP